MFILFKNNVNFRQNNIFKIAINLFELYNNYYIIRQIIDLLFLFSMKFVMIIFILYFY